MASEQFNFDSPGYECIRVDSSIAPGVNRLDCVQLSNPTGALLGCGGGVLS